MILECRKARREVGRYFEPQNIEQGISNIEVIITHFCGSLFCCSILSFGLPTLRAGPQFQNSKPVFSLTIGTTHMYLAPHGNYMSPLPSRDSLAVRHPGQVPQSGARAGIQKEFDYFEL